MYSIAVIRFPGTNCHEETCRALLRVGLRPRLLRWNENDVDWSYFDGYVLPGGFSYEDRVRAGVIASKHPIMAHIAEQSLSGKPILGICNGAQILVETFLIPGMEYQGKVALDRNNQGYINAWVHIKNEGRSGRTPFNLFSETHIFPLPVAHGEGRFVIAPDVFPQLLENDQFIFRYCNPRGYVIDRFPINPNGSFYSVAGLSNVAGNILALMPHPERTKEGIVVFDSMKNFLEDKKVFPVHHSSTPVSGSLSSIQVSPYTSAPNSIQIWTQLIIADNEAETLQTALRDAGFSNLEVRRWGHWEVELDPNVKGSDIVSSIVESGELLNTNKEIFFEGKPPDIPFDERLVLVRPKDDFFGENKKCVLSDILGLRGFHHIRSGVVWGMRTDSASFEKILSNGILAHPSAQNIFLISQSMPRFQSNYAERIRQHLDQRIHRVVFQGHEPKRGKVRDIFINRETVVAVATDRMTAFDRHLATIPFKGQVLNQVSAWWFDRTHSIISNHLLGVPDPHVSVWKKCVVFPIEVVVRAYLTGSTDTAIWTQYQKGCREFGGVTLPDGMRKNDPLPRPIVTPTTKSQKHDRNISSCDIVREGMAMAEEWDYMSQKALKLFDFGQKEALKRGLILVDTKYEFGKDASGNILLVDELHTPDSSRYWIAEGVESRLASGQEPENIDKEFLRLWFSKHCDPYHDEVLPEAPEELVVELSSRYIQLYELITGEKFSFPEKNESVLEEISNTLQPFFNVRSETLKKGRAVLLLGSEKDRLHAQKIVDALDSFDIPSFVYVASAHKEPLKVLGILEEYKNQKKIVFVTVAGRSNALSGFVAANSAFPTIACPPFLDAMDMFINIHSTLQMPSKVPVMTVLDPGNAALAVKRILGVF